MKWAFQKKKKSNKIQTINLYISSVYHSTDKILQSEFNDYLSNIYSTIPSNYAFISGQDLNASIVKNLRWNFVKILDILGLIIGMIKD